LHAKTRAEPSAGSAPPQLGHAIATGSFCGCARSNARSTSSPTKQATPVVIVGSARVRIERRHFVQPSQPLGFALAAAASGAIASAQATQRGGSRR
jgi:hypothetical protein